MTSSLRSEFAEFSTLELVDWPVKPDAQAPAEALALKDLIK